MITETSFARSSSLLFLRYAPNSVDLKAGTAGVVFLCSQPDISHPLPTSKCSVSCRALAFASTLGDSHKNRLRRCCDQPSLPHPRFQLGVKAIPWSSCSASESLTAVELLRWAVMSASIVAAYIHDAAPVSPHPRTATVRGAGEDAFPVKSSCAPVVQDLRVLSP